MSIREPDLESWNRYDPEEVPEEKRRLILRTLSEYGVPMYYILTILKQSTGYCLTDYCTTFWRRWKEEGTHWAWLDELKLVKRDEERRREE